METTGWTSVEPSNLTTTFERCVFKVRSSSFPVSGIYYVLLMLMLIDTKLDNLTATHTLQYPMI